MRECPVFLAALALFALVLISCQPQGQEWIIPQDNFSSGDGSIASQREGVQQSATDAGTQNDWQFNALKSNLQRASGGISPDTYREIDGKIKALEEGGFDPIKTQQLRELLARLPIGGQEDTSQKEPDPKKITPFESDVVTWHYRDGKWVSTNTPPDCPDPFTIQSPVDLNLVSAILYPGQVRTGDFKPHGGFRTDRQDGPIEVKSPIEGYIWRVAKFYDEFGLHYIFDIQHPCGIMVRLGHLGEVPPKIEAIFDGFPVRERGDSRTELVEPIFVELGETIATDTQHGSGFDLGMYDLRKENEASKDPAFRQALAEEAEQAYHALCWFDYLPQDQQAIVKGLPAADGISGKKSDYC